ncbi:hypothetical protein [Pararhizobium gei]|uniref:hypothetical protein n=1 Tax=Pararhizobium gei TaxID=1395951 RepID=UPI0023DAE873|nr:hypothetical protein [Rhizobium gei]
MIDEVTHISPIETLMKLAEVRQMTKLGTTSTYGRMKAGTFPRPRLGNLRVFRGPFSQLRQGRRLKLPPRIESMKQCPTRKRSPDVGALLLYGND